MSLYCRFLELWSSMDYDGIRNLFPSDLFKNGMVLHCHFDSDLLVLSNIPYYFTPFDVCNCLGIVYETFFGCYTFLAEDIIFNMSKVKSFYSM